MFVVNGKSSSRHFPKAMLNNENDAVIQELSHYATCLKTEVEYLRKENRKLQQQVLKLTERFDLETYFLKGVLREKHSRIAVLNDLLHRAKAEKEKFETEKANVVQILKKQQQVFQAKNGRILQLEEELGRNRDAQEACVGFGYSREDVSEAVLVWGRINPGYKAEDLMKILIERNREWHEGVVTEENQMETEGAVGGQDEL
ncbi:uncharacterized protein LOC128553125 [Mercenaria mercenaria]|uniref:uncharacterized protein LOC128553125 n=1 Tax=Mercenaria mercenaria TaxID=6596 RepID=UPI00234E8711|nr:uncharacterized protein LOC128553125 [Mercenaria mercenaria]